jgi:3-methyl-2-oxobutanoate hydroxymethyltransferase
MRRKNKLSILELEKMKRAREPVTWITAYDLPFAYASEQAGIDMILVGDSGGMVQLGHQTTNPVTMEEMIILSKAVRRGAPNTFIVGDMPQGSYEVCDEDAVRNALRFIKEAGCDAVKLEGGRRMASRVSAINNAGILVFGHLGLTPQSAASFGGYRVQGKSVESFDGIMEDSIALQDAGAVAILLEAMPSEPAGHVARSLRIPILGIGAGKEVDGQLVIMHDVLGFYQAFRPWFAKCYIPQVVTRFQSHIKGYEDLRKMGREERKDGLLMLAQLAVEEYAAEVRAGQFPGPEYCYEIQPADLAALRQSAYWDKSGSASHKTARPQSA